MSWQFSGAIDSSNIDDFQEAFNSEVLPKINEFLKNYKLNAGGTHMTYSSDGIKISFNTSYALEGGRKPWADSNFFEKAERLYKYRVDRPQDFEDANEVRKFYEALPKDRVIIGKRVCIPSKKFPYEMFKVLDYCPEDRYPFKLLRERDQKHMDYIWDWNYRFEN